MTFSYIHKIISRDGIVYIEDAVNEVAIKLFMERSKLVAFIKKHGKREKMTTIDKVYDNLPNCNAITKEQYKQF